MTRASAENGNTRRKGCLGGCGRRESRRKLDESSGILGSTGASTRAVGCSAGSLLELGEAGHVRRAGLGCRVEGAPVGGSCR